MTTSKICFLLSTTLLAACPYPETDTDTETDTILETDSASVTSNQTTNEPTTSSTDTTGDTTGGTTGDTTDGDMTSSSTGSGNIPDLNCFELEEVLSDPAVVQTKCDEHPWERKPECMTTGTPPMPTCEEMMEILDNHPGCEEIDLCDYIVCADALAKAECTERPAECDPIVACLNMAAPLTALERLYFEFLKLFAGD